MAWMAYLGHTGGAAACWSVPCGEAHGWRGAPMPAAETGRELPGADRRSKAIGSHAIHSRAVRGREVARGADRRGGRALCRADSEWPEPRARRRLGWHGRAARPRGARRSCTADGADHTRQHQRVDADAGSRRTGANGEWLCDYTRTDGCRAVRSHAAERAPRTDGRRAAGAQPRTYDRRAPALLRHVPASLALARQ